MYTECLIQFIDDSSEIYAIIKADETLDDRDELIFFYGLSRNDLIMGMKNGVIFENEWKVISVGKTW